MATLEERVAALEARVDALDGGVAVPLSHPAQVKIEYDKITKTALLSWSSVEGASMYEVYGSLNDADLTFLINTDKLQRQSGELKAGTVLKYAVAAVGASGTEKSPLSPVVSFVVPTDSVDPPVEPPPASGNVPWSRIFPDGRAYNPPTPSKTVAYSGQALAGLKDTRVTGIKLAKGKTLEVKDATNCIFEIEAKFQQAGDMVKFRGTTRRVGIYNSVFGPDSEETAGFTETCQFLYFGDNVEDVYVSGTTFQNKSSAGNALRVYGTFRRCWSKGRRTLHRHHKLPVQEHPTV